MSKLGKSRKIGLSVAVACCMLLATIFSADIKKLFVLATDALSALISTDETTDTSTTIVMRTDDAYDGYETDGYYAFSVYAPSTATYTIGVTAENGSVRVNTGEAISVNGTEMSVSLAEGTNVLYIMGCSSPSIQWDRETCDLEPINRVCTLLAGDLDQDGERTLLELLRLKKEAAVNGTLTTDTLARTEVADIDRDNSITDEDARLLRELLVGNPRYEASELRAVIVDAYLADTGILYDSLADAIAAASTISVSDSKTVTVTVLNPTDVKLTARVPVEGGAQIILQDDGTKDSESVHNGWCRTITRGSTKNFKMFAVGDASLTLAGSSGSDENSSLILDGGAIANSGNHIVDVGNNIPAATATLTMNAGVKITNNENSSSYGGGALAIKTTFNMNGGIISGNIATGSGGAINLIGGSTMTMKGGIITENETKAETFSGGGINVSGNATLIMEGGTVYGNISPVSVDNNSVRVSGETSVLKMGGSAYIDRVSLDTASSITPYIELTSALTTTEKITLFFPQPLNKTGVVVSNSSYAQETTFDLSDRMLPCKLVQDDSNENLCLQSDITEMDSVKATLQYSNYTAFSDIDDTWTVQGVCTDGTYLYVAIEQEMTVGVTYNGCRILKVNLATWEQEAISSVLATDHSNEMTYNPTTGKIYVTHCMSSGEFEETTGITSETGPYAISVVDPATLTVESVITLPDTTAYTGTTGIYALAYDDTQKHYVAGCTGFRFGFLTDDNGTITECAMPSTGMEGFTGYTGYTKQGVYANATTIYANTWNDKEINKGNFITMYDWSGNYNGTKYVVDKDGNAFTQESESMFEYNGDMYLACIPTGHVGVDIYKLEDVGTVVSTIDVIDATGNTVDGVYTNLADAIEKANELETATIVLKDDVTIGATQTITGNVTITDDGTRRTLQRSTGCTEEMFNVAGGAELTFTSSTKDDSNPMLVIDGNKANVEIESAAYAPVVDMNQTNGILNITPGVIVQNNKSGNTGGVIFAGLNGTTSKSGSQATINITGGLFTGNEVEYSSSKYLFGGCIYIESGCTLNISNATFENTKVAQNCADGFTYGGVISVRTNASHLYDGANVTLENCIFKNTSVTQKGSGNGGGVLYIGASNPSSVQVANCEFTGNATEGLGGAIYMSNTATALDLSGCSFSGNTDVNGTNDIYMVASTNVNVSGNTQVNINCAGTEQIHITESLGTESVIKVTMSNAAAGAAVATFASETIMTACKENRNIVLSETSYALSYDATNLNATLVEAVAVVGDSGCASLAEAIDVASTMESDAENPVVITLISDTVAIDSVTTIPTGTFVEITDDGTQRTLQRTDGCTNEMFNVEGGAGLTFTSSSKDDSNPMLVIDGNKENVEIATAAYAPVVDMNQTNGILNITPGVIVQNNKSGNTGGVIFAGLNGTTSKSGSQATINITGGLFTGNEVEYSSSKYLFGGCIYIESGCTLNISNATFENTTMAQNCTGGMTYGGVISVRTNASHLYDGASVTLENCIFKNTSVTQKGSGNGGGVLYIGASNPSSVQVTNCEFISNATEGFGGAIYMSNTTTALDLSGCSFSGNTDVNGTNDIYMAASTDVNVSGNTKVNINCAGTEQIHITESLGTESVIKVTMSNAAAGATVATFASEAIMTACKENRNIVLSETSYALSYDATNLNATLVEAVAVVGDSGYASLAEAIDVASTMESDAENPVVITLISDTVAIDSVTTIPTGTFVEITDDGTQRTLQRTDGCTEEMFNVAGGAELTFTSSTKDDSNPMLVIDGNKANVEIESAAYAPVVDMNQTNGILNITPGVIVQNNKSGNTGGVIFAGLNGTTNKSGSQATINITGGLFTGNEVEYSASKYLFGGCIYIESGCTLNISNATFENTTMAQNCTGGMTYGGVISVRTNASHLYDGANVTLENCIFKNTSVTQKGSGNGGGVLYIGASNPSSVQVTNCEFTGNATEGLGGVIYMSNTTTALDLSGCSFSGNTDANGTNDIYMVASTKVNVSGNTQANINCAGTEQIHITESLGTESVIQMNVSNATAGATVATFASEEIMNACIANENLVLTNREYLLSYETTSNSEYIATLVDVVAMIGEQGYASFEDAIEAANALESATIVLKADATVDETQAITGNVTITDDGTAKTLKRGAECTAQVFDVQEGASLTILGTGALAEDGSTVQGIITVDGNKENVTATASMINNAGTFTLGTNASLTNAGNEDDETTTGGALYNAGTATLAGTLSGNEAYKGGALYNASGTMTITGGTFESNSAYHGGVVYTAVGATLNITGGTFGTEGKGNTSGHRAGVVYVQEGTGTETIASATISNATFSYNTSTNSSATSAGVLYAGKYVNVEIDGCTFSNNSVTCSGSYKTYGGAIYMYNATVEINNSAFSSCSAIRGGAIYVASSGKLTLNDCDFGVDDEANTVTEYGQDIHAESGSLYLSGKASMVIDKKNVIIYINEILESGSNIAIGQLSNYSTMAQFGSEEIMNDCKNNGYITVTSKNATLTNSGKTLTYESNQAIMK